MHGNDDALPSKQSGDGRCVRGTKKDARARINGKFDLFPKVTFKSAHSAPRDMLPPARAIWATGRRENRSGDFRPLGQNRVQRAQDFVGITLHARDGLR